MQHEDEKKARVRRAQRRQRESKDAAPNGWQRRLMLRRASWDLWRVDLSPGPEEYPHTWHLFENQ